VQGLELAKREDSFLDIVMGVLGFGLNNGFNLSLIIFYSGEVFRLSMCFELLATP
jgi:hypothetical protein